MERLNFVGVIGFLPETTEVSVDEELLAIREKVLIQEPSLF